MRTAFALILIGSLAFVALSRDLIAEATGKPFLGISPVQAESLQLDADFSTPNLEGITRLEAGVFKKLLERRRERRICPSCGRNVPTCGCF